MQRFNFARNITPIIINNHNNKNFSSSSPIFIITTLISRMSSSFNSSLAGARELDKNDIVAKNRDSFHFPKQSAIRKNAMFKSDEADRFIYLCGHSLGLQHEGVEAALQQEVLKWRDQAVEGHFLQPNPWFEIDNILRKDMADLVGARESEVVIMNSLTANLHLLLARFYQPSGKRTKILCEKYPFPSDMHALVSVVKNRGYDADHVVEVRDEKDAAATSDSGEAIIDFVLTTDQILAAIEKHGEEVAVLLFSSVHFLSGQYFDIGRITKAAHDKGITVGIDCAHGAGNVPLKLHDWNVDFACWCTYKYLNGGPGNIGGLFVHDNHKSDDPKALHGWWGHKIQNRFSLHKEFDASEGAAVMQLSNPSVMCLMSLAPSIRCMAKVGIDNLRAKSVKLTGYLEELLAHYKISDRCLVRITPEDPEQRGAMLTFYIKPNTIRPEVAQEEKDKTSYENGTNLNNDADLLQRLLLNRGIMCDNRPPNIVRITAVPLYNSFEDVWSFVDTLRSIFTEEK